MKRAQEIQQKVFFIAAIGVALLVFSGVNLP